MLEETFRQILEICPYKSPTDMGVNMVGNCITDDEAVKEAARQEIIRRYYTALCDHKKGTASDEVVRKLELLMKKGNVDLSSRKVVAAALEKAAATGKPAVALQLPDGQIVTGKTSSLLGASAAATLNALKALGGIRDNLHLISPVAIDPIQKLKTGYLGNRNPRLHTDEILIALSISAATNPTAELAMEQLPGLRGCELHSTVILSEVDERTFKRLGIRVTCEPQFKG